MNLLFNATTIPSALMFSALNEQDVLCRVFGDCLAGDPLDRELGSLMPGVGPLSDGQKHFTYVRYNTRTHARRSRRNRLQNIQPEAVQKLNSIDAIPELLEVGTAVAEMKVKQDHFARFPPKLNLVAVRREWRAGAASTEKLDVIDPPRIRHHAVRSEEGPG